MPQWMPFRGSKRRRGEAESRRKSKMVSGADLSNIVAEATGTTHHSDADSNDPPLACSVSAALGLRELPSETRRALREARFTDAEVASSFSDILACVRCLHSGAAAAVRTQQQQQQRGPSSRQYSLKELALPGDPRVLYTGVSMLDSGAQGELYRATEVWEGGRNVALKRIRIRDEHADIPALESELSMHCSAHHPNVVHFYGCYYLQKSLWVSMELMNGGKLTNLLEDGHRFTAAETAYILREVMKGVQYLHQTGRVHKGITGDSVLISTKGQVKLADFGFLSADCGCGAARAPVWMAPEVVIGGSSETAADVWGVGVLAVAVADGGPPMRGVPVLRAMHTVVAKPAPTADDHGSFPPPFADFVASALRKDPSSRPPVEELLEHPFVGWADQTDGGFLREALCRI